MNVEIRRVLAELAGTSVVALSDLTVRQATLIDALLARSEAA